MADPDTSTRTMVVVLSVRCTRPIDVANATEILARPAAALALDGLQPLISIDTDDEDDD